jgi:hypothetical protein
VIQILFIYKLLSPTRFISQVDLNTPQLSQVDQNTPQLKFFFHSCVGALDVQSGSRLGAIQKPNMTSGPLEEHNVLDKLFFSV